MFIEATPVVVEEDAICCETVEGSETAVRMVCTRGYRFGSEGLVVLPLVGPQKEQRPTRRQRLRQQ